MAGALLTLRDIHITFGGHPLLEGAELTLEPHDRLCLVGRNGSGKSTLLKIAAGLLAPDKGECFLHPNAVVRYLPQEPDFKGTETVLDYVAAGLNPIDPLHSALLAVEDMGLTGTEKTAFLSGGEARRAGLARTLVGAPDIVLLDEPTNHLDLPTIEKIENHLRTLRSALILVSHDRRFLEALSYKTLWIDRGKTRPFHQGFVAFEDWRDTVLEQEEIQRHKRDRKIHREENWMHGGVTGRRKRNVRRVRELEALRQAKREERRAGDTVQFTLSSAALSSRLIVEAQDICKSYEGKVLIKNLSLRILRGDRIGIIGPNGAGKSTLLQILTGALPPDAGKIRYGQNIELVTLDQKRMDLDPELSLLEALTGGKGDSLIISGKPRHAISYLKDFLFTGEQVRSPLKVLSGGERGRLMLARVLAKPSNVLVLDEPTNDLDLETLDLLQELLTEYLGTILLVSHDRDFLDRCVTSVLAWEGHGLWREYAGGYTDMLAQKGRRNDTTPTFLLKREDKKETRRQSPLEGPTVQPLKRKLSFKERHALETLPQTIESLQTEIEILQNLLKDPDLYVKDPMHCYALTEQLAKAQKDLSTAEDQWIELELLRESFET